MVICCGYKSIAVADDESIWVINKSFVKSLISYFLFILSIFSCSNSPFLARHWFSSVFLANERNLYGSIYKAANNLHYYLSFLLQILNPVLIKFHIWLESCTYCFWIYVVLYNYTDQLQNNFKWNILPIINFGCLQGKTLIIVFFL